MTRGTSHRFLIVRLGSLGDVIHGIPVAAALRERFPVARIDWLVDPRYVPLLDLVQGLDVRIPVSTRRPSRVLSTIRDLRHVRYTAAIDFTDHARAEARLRETNAFMDAQEADLDGIRLQMPLDA